MNDDEPPYDPDDKFTWKAGEIIWGQCLYCRHLDQATRTTCRAFPRGIPDAFMANAADHRQPWRGDRGVRFEPRPDVEGEITERLYRIIDRLAEEES
jgi:hypothetical protein